MISTHTTIDTVKKDNSVYDTRPIPWDRTCTKNERGDLGNNTDCISSVIEVIYLFFKRNKFSQMKDTKPGGLLTNVRWFILIHKLLVFILIQTKTNWLVNYKDNDIIFEILPFPIQITHKDTGNTTYVINTYLQLIYLLI